jgi:hypothetical protein
MTDRIDHLLAAADQNESESSVSFDRREFPDADGARSFFSGAKAALADIRKWNEYATLSGFELFGDDGNGREGGNILEGDFIRISLAGSGKDDWVRVIEIYESDSEFIVVVKPTFDPTDKSPDRAATSHFFTSEAVNNFCLAMNGQSVFSYIIGLNEKQNTSETGGVLETVRNVATANLGSYLGIQKGEWTAFCKNLLFPDNL